MIINILKILILDDLITFIDFWFFHFPKILIRNYFNQIYSFDQSLKLKSNLRNITKPLYGDYSIIGYFISFPYRILRVFLAFLFYLFLAIFYIIFLLAWVGFPIFLILHGILLSK